VAEWVRPLGEGAQKRHWHETTRGKVVGFSVQLEVWFGDGWQPILRYDAAHGFAHRDVYETPSRKHKERIDLTLPETLTLADRDIDRNWQRYAEAFRKGNKR
jgi:hypothetical protein